MRFKKTVLFAMVLVLTMIASSAFAYKDIFDAARNGTAKDVQKFIKKGKNGNVNARQGDKKLTPLMCAIIYNEEHIIEILEVLTQAGADVNAQDSEEITALNYAIGKNRSVEVVKALIQAGADVNVRSNRYGGNKETALLMVAGESLNPEIMRMLIEAGADVNIGDDYNDTALIRAASNYLARDYYKEGIEMLLQAGADVNAKNKYKQTALMIAAENASDPEVIKILLGYGADIKMKDHDGQTALDYAEHNGSSRAAEIREILRNPQSAKKAAPKSKSKPKVDKPAKKQASIQGTWRVTDGDNVSTLVIDGDGTSTLYDEENEKVGSGYIQREDSDGHYGLYMFDDFLMDLYFDPDDDTLRAVFDEEDDEGFVIYLRVKD